MEVGLDKCSLTSLLIGLLFLNYVSSRLIGNEEHYLQLAQFFVDPSWVPNSFLLSDLPTHRIFFMWVAGPMVDVLGFYWTAAIGRAVLILIMVPALVRIFKTIPLSNAKWLILFQMVLLTNQSFFGQEWIFLAFEPKTLAYAALLWALVFFQDKKWWPMVILLALATYFHILVGLLSSVAFLGTQVLFEYKSKRFWAAAGLWIFMVLPFVWWIKSGLTPPTGLSPSEDWIYTQYRNPHHTAPFADMDIFYGKYLLGIVLVTLLITFLVRNFSRIEAYGRPMRTLIVLTLCSSIGALLLAYVDSEGHLMKYYPFRLQVWGVFFGLPLVFVSLTKWLKNRPWNSLLYLGLFLATTVSATKSFTDQFFSLNGRIPEEKSVEYLEAIDAINSQIPEKGQIVLFFTPGKKVNKFDYTNFTRLTRQERYASFKFVPTTSKKLRIWYDRLQRKEHLYGHPIELTQSPIRDEVNYILSTEALTEFFGQPMFRNDKYYLYKLKS